MDNKAKQKPPIELIPGYLKGEPIVKINFKYNKGIIDTIKAIPGRRWDQQNRTGIFQGTF